MRSVRQREPLRLRQGNRLINMADPCKGQAAKLQSTERTVDPPMCWPTKFANVRGAGTTAISWGAPRYLVEYNSAAANPIPSTLAWRGDAKIGGSQKEMP